ncbi:MAG TPA: CehA/McbA family metallohydrolase [Kofleriaceae bacterium]|nr:CehA/McbA family metallohydrolase [Kofleriaceae bacterium]
MLLAALAALPMTIHLEGDVTADGGDYADVTFQCPAGTAEFTIEHTTTPAADILDYGVWGPDGFRGWSGGLSEPLTIGVAQSSRGYLPGPIGDGTWTISLGKALVDPAGAHYAIDITCRATATLPVLPRAEYTPIVLSTQRRWYQGDFHVHSVQSGDASASLQANIDLAHSRGLDFINASDHNTISQHALIAAQQAAWPVLAMRGAEITTYSGHGNAVGIHDYVDHRLGRAGRTITNVIADVKAQGGIFIVNHPATDLGTACIGCGWKHVDDAPWDEVAGIEILTAGYSLGILAYTPKVIELWDALEDQGHRLSAVSGSDDHSAGIDEGTIGAPVGSPTAIVLADQLSEAAIIDGVRKHHTKVKLRGPDDPDVDVQMKTAAGGLADIGDDVAGIGQVEIPAHITGGDGDFLQLWRDGAMTAEIQVKGDDFSTTLTDVPSAGAHRYRVELDDQGGERVVVTSHWYVQATGEATGGGKGDGGCSTGSGGALAGFVIPLLGLVLRRRRARS